MSKVSKAANYTEEQVKAMSSMYTGQDNKTEVARIAAQIGKTPASIRAKLATMGLYQKAEPAKTENGERVTKVTKAAQIASATGMNEIETEALTKTTSAVLDKLLAKLTN